MYIVISIIEHSRGYLDPTKKKLPMMHDDGTGGVSMLRKRLFTDRRGNDSGTGNDENIPILASGPLSSPTIPSMATYLSPLPSS